MKTPKDVLFWTGTTLATLFFGLLAFLSLSEWRIVQVKKQTEGYSWGPVNENPWYYENPELYSKVIFIEGLAFTIILVILTTQVIKANKKRILYTLMFGLGLFILMIANGAIK